MVAMVKEDLARPCDAGGKAIGGGYRRCEKCNIYFCFFCSTQLMLSQHDDEIEIRCPMCNEYMVFLSRLRSFSICVEG
jgi:DNA-directed RNA polymerase subunit RPC12/RpoP